MTDIANECLITTSPHCWSVLCPETSQNMRLWSTEMPNAQRNNCFQFLNFSARTEADSVCRVSTFQLRENGPQREDTLLSAAAGAQPLMGHLERGPCTPGARVHSPVSPTAGGPVPPTVPRAAELPVGACVSLIHVLSGATWALRCWAAEGPSRFPCEAL